MPLSRPPFDLSDVELPPELFPVAESIARGLQGTQSELPPQAAVDVLKAVLALGYGIEQAEPHAPRLGSKLLSDVAERLEASGAFELPDLLSIWKSVADLRRVHGPGSYAEIAARILERGEPLLAFDVLRAGLERQPQDVRLRQLQALALARSGATEAAGRALHDLIAEGHEDGETLGMLARTSKDRWATATRDPARQRHLQSAYEAYARGFRLAQAQDNRDDAVYTGINAAAMAFLLGRALEAESLAREVRRLCLEDPAQDGNYWRQASLGEAAVILGELSEAERRYAAAAEIGKTRYADLSSTRRNARLLLEARGEAPAGLDRCFRIPRVVVFTGHMIDAPDRAHPRFPPALLDRARQEIENRLEALDAGFGFSSAACGADLLFLEAMRRRGAETHIVLPLPPQEFERTSVASAPGADWREQYRRALAEATRVIVASEHRISESPIVFEYANRIQDGLAMLKARTLQTGLTPLAVWNGQPPIAPGGAAWMVQFWKDHGRNPEVINLQQLLVEEIPSAGLLAGEPSEPEPASEHVESLPQAVKAILFADVVGFSQLHEEELPAFVEHFLHIVAAWMHDSTSRPESANTWGDALFFVFATVAEAGVCALRLSEYMAAVDWSAKGFHCDLALRIGLHAGPVYSCTDPITRQQSHIGSHVNRAARIEPVTPTGQVYASEAFAALAASECVAEFACDYVGLTALAKSYGAFPTYHLRRTAQREDSNQNE